MSTFKLVAVSAAFMMPVMATAAVLDFESLRHVDAGTIDVGTTYSEDGFTISQSETQPTFYLSAFGTLASRFPGSTALYHNQAFDGFLNLVAIGGGSFSLDFIDLSEFDDGGAFSVTFNAIGRLGGSFSQSFNLDGIFGMETFAFDSVFDDVVSVSWGQVDPYHQFDNVVVNSGYGVAPVPIPATLPLLGGALALLGLGVRSRRG